MQMLPAEPPSVAAAPLQESTQALPSLSAPTWMGQFAIPAQDFSAERVGAKSMNTSRLQVFSKLIHQHNSLSQEPGP